MAVSAPATDLAANHLPLPHRRGTDLGGATYGGDQTFTTLASVAGCSDYSANNAGGGWSTASDWSTGSPPSSGEGACVLANGTYTVTMEQTSGSGTVSVHSLTIEGKEGSAETRWLWPARACRTRN